MVSTRAAGLGWLTENPFACSVLKWMLALKVWLEFDNCGAVPKNFYLDRRHVVCAPAWPELTLRIHYAQLTLIAGNGVSPWLRVSFSGSPVAPGYLKFGRATGSWLLVAQLG